MKTGTKNKEVFKKVHQSHKEGILEVFKTNKNGRLTSKTIQIILKFERLDQVTKRCVELETEGLIVDQGYSTTINGRHFTFYLLTPVDQIEKMKLKRKNQLNIDWLSQGKRKGYITSMDYDRMIYELTQKMNNNNQKL